MNIMNIKLLNHSVVDKIGKGLSDSGYGYKLALATFTIAIVLGMNGAYHAALANAFVLINR